MKKLVFLLVIFFSVPLYAATYYIDFETGVDTNPGTREAPWKYVPGMVGWTGTHTVKPGDRYVFKGGVSWIIDLPKGIYTCWKIGTSGNPEDGYISYTVDKNWFKGNVWTRPKFKPKSPIDGSVVGRLIYASKIKYIKINGLEFRETGKPGVTYANRTINALNISHWDITNCKFQPYDSYALVFGMGVSDVNIQKNEFSDAIGYIEMSYSAPGIHNLDISHNTFGSIKSMNVDGRHADGVQLHDVKNTGDLTNFRLHDNHFTGNWGVEQPGSSFNSCFYINSRDQVTTGPVLVYNNLVDITYEGADPDFRVNAIFVSEYGAATKFYNNTIRHDGTPGIYNAIFRVRSMEGSTVEIVGNIIDNCVASKTFWFINYAKDIICNNNIIYNYKEPCIGYRGAGCKTIGTWQNEYGLDVNSYTSNPNLDASGVPVPPSDAIDNAPAHTEFSDDYRGISRPRGGGWDIGAFEYDSGIARIAPVIKSIDPESVEEGSKAFTLKIKGENFVNNGMSLSWNGQKIPFTWINENEISVMIKESELKKRGYFPVSVQNSNGSSGVVYFQIKTKKPQVLRVKSISK